MAWMSRSRATMGLVAIVVGAAVGIGSYTFLYARGYSYLTNNPAACANCHVMQSHMDAWYKSSHHAVATCNDCHAPHDAPVAKMWVKARNGYNHSRAFTTGDFPEPIRITPFNRNVTEEACRYCHHDIVRAIDHGSRDEDRLACIRCHSDVGHPL
jgi:cytochrome c nitrite reductase small subunit